jgi:thiamine-monophosphate kinase
MHPFSSHLPETVSALGERRLIEAIRRWLGDTSPRTPFGIGDDCAVLPAMPGHSLLTVDPVIYGEHFDDAVSPRAAGEKLLKRNLSDIAAMGGRPVAAVVALAFDGRLKIRWLAAFYRGLAAVSRRYEVPIVGGDIARQREGVVATLTLLGRAAASRVVTRTGARPGDDIYVTGHLGGSRVRHHWAFTPRLDQGAWLARQRGVRSMMDVSDGLAKDLLALAPAGTVPALDRAALPVSAAARRLARTSGRTALDHALSDGEDYELVFSLAANAPAGPFEARWRRTFPSLPLTRIGRFLAPKEARAAGAFDLAAYHGFEHLAHLPDAPRTPRRRRPPP